MDRPSRKTKVVNYSEPKDFDDDEDFACSKAPPSKKSREEIKPEQKNPSSKSSSQESDSRSSQSQKSRKPLDEKLFSRDLETAITLSLLNNAVEKKEPPHASTGVVKVQVDENTDPSTVRLSNCSVDGDHMGLNKITPENRRQKKAEDPKKKGEDEDYQPKLTPGESESDEDYSEPDESEDESEDEEFTVKKSSKAKTKEKVTKKTKPAPASKKEKQTSAKTLKSKPQTAVRTPPAAKVSSPKTSSSSPFTSKPLYSPSPAGGRLPKWTPPAQVGKSPTSSQRPAGRSPGQGLRLGLSRLVRVKPLHPSVTSH